MIRSGQLTGLFEIKVKVNEAVKFAEILNDLPLAKSARTGQPFVPTTYPIVFWQKAEIPWLKDIGHLVHGEQSFSYKKPMLTEHTYYVEIKLVDVKEKEGKAGKVVWLMHEMYGYQDQDKEHLVFIGKTKAMFRTGRGS
ncbi:FAS1-like dehydratase domain-containing protein [Pseudalkalibacillus salsuginis]|uniref:FAS1-like dehydratase domain-containing protein n=1 Tax=Pseudalkalibacillus salsuginis TaxID=2910972 RepID=UPI001F2010F0|nr:MaoC family dehydratase N-terminal domain-containing protein [Pseudalkalibacillus salsuginis]MCF6408884.1 MaoC family dehydratase N-terminal domain-containing protein [Pseudalkalibacillus salsuginis]